MFRLITILTITLAILVNATDRFEQEPILYSKTKDDNVVSRLKEKLDKGEMTFKRDKTFGYLPSLMKALNIDVNSQTMVFSKTSLQAKLISPKRPRALYFNDEVYLGYVPYSNVVEISVADPQLGAVFYTFDQNKKKLLRDRGECFQCHASSRTGNRPGHFLRSVFPATDGQPIFRAGGKIVDHTVPYEKRWGGWYVSGIHGWVKHMANQKLEDTGKNEISMDLSKGANIDQLDGFFDKSLYLSSHSDLVAMIVQDHQVKMHNLLQEANYQTRFALYDQEVINKALGEKPDKMRDSTKSRIKSVGEKLLSYMLFINEAKLVSRVRGTTDFAKSFSARGPKDAKGRSLYHLDLKQRMLKYPCSYLIYSDAFSQLPKEMKAYLYKRLWEILTAKDKSEKYAKMTSSDKTAIYEILKATLKDLPDYWQ